MSSSNPFSASVEKCTQIEAGFVFGHHTSDPLEAFDNECLQSFVFHSSNDDLDLFENLL